MLICCLLFIAMVIPCFSAEQQSEKKYDPLDLVVVVDSSGSMISSDPQRTAMAAVRMLVNMMPADSRVGVVGFNTKATVWTKDASGNPALLSLEDYMGAESVRDAVTNIQYNGGTGIGNAVHRATELLEGQKTDGRKKAIMLFTDGVDDFGLTMEVDFTSQAEFDVTFTHSSKDAAVTGKLTVSPFPTSPSLRQRAPLILVSPATGSSM